MKSPSIAMVGLACEYPGARSPAELWENVLAGRRMFRRIPTERLRIEDYGSSDPTAPDRTYAIEAALIEGYEFDRVGFRVSGSSYRSADLAHWLALDVAARALADAGFEGGDGLPRETTGVFLGNTLTGEFSRADTLRLRWPYARRVVDATLREEGWSASHRAGFLGRLEASYKSPFPPAGEETLAGGLSNTIAGRICNHFDLNGGGYTVDGACASSLLAVAHACSSLAAGDLDAALAGGVDLSLDPFELVGFAKVGALAQGEMRIYDRRSAGFLPGEGCGVVVLMRRDDAEAMGLRVLAVIRGWGISSDGRGGLTRPEVEGQLLALDRAYRRAGFPIGTVSYFEGHGTGTAVGDATELGALTRALRESGCNRPTSAIGSIKANIGHTKAAAGVAGLIKAAMALDARLLPPTTGCEQPHALLSGDGSPLRILEKGESWPDDRPLRAGISAMGFGGINAHVVLESPDDQRRPRIGPRERALLDAPQDAELFLLDGRDEIELGRRVEALLEFAGRLSLAELTDLAAHLAGSLNGGQARAAVVASRPAELAARLESLRGILDGEPGHPVVMDGSGEAFLGRVGTTPRIGFLFPGQGTSATRDGGAWGRRFPAVAAIYRRAGLPASGDPHATEFAQPAIIAAELAALTVLRELGIEAVAAVGHSLGELAALHWAESVDGDSLLRIAAARGRAMAGLPGEGGTMAGLEAGEAEVRGLINGDLVAIAGINGPRQTVISGATSAVTAVVERARRRGWNATRLAVSHAFHSAMVAGASAPLAASLDHESILGPRRPIASTVVGSLLDADIDVRALLLRQITAPVRFLEAVEAVASDIDLWIEVGPGRVLTGLVDGWIAAPAVATEAGGPSLRGLLRAVGAAFAFGAPIRTAALCEGRFRRPFPDTYRPRFFENPCERAPSTSEDLPSTIVEEPAPVVTVRPSDTDEPIIEQVRRAVAERAELPLASVVDDSRLLGDLHLNSITVGQIVVGLAGRLGAAIPIEPTSYATATVAEVAGALEELVRAGPGGTGPITIAGVAPWFRAFVPALAERPRPPRPAPGESGPWQVMALPGDALADRLREAIGRAHDGRGVIVCLPPDPDERHAGLLLESARLLISDPDADRFVMVQHGGGAASFARTIHEEYPGVSACVVDVPLDHPEAPGWIVDEAEAASGFVEAHYDEAGRRREPILHLMPMVEPAERPGLGPDDVLLVSGGGKGIAAECALAMARETGVRLALIGRARPEDDPALAANLERMKAAGASVEYRQADVADPDGVRAAVRSFESSFGPITAILHAAGVNVPRPLETLDEAAFGETLAPKLTGLRNLLAAVPSERLRRLVSFGSIIGRTGMAGEADYGVANEWLARATERFGREHPGCRCLTLEWSVWSGVGMGDRLGRLEALSRRGIAAIPPDAGVDLFRRLIAAPSASGSMIVAGRFGIPPALPVDGEELPLLRFLERPLVDYPGIELVADADLNTEADPYLDDHVFRGERLFPAVMGLEAMAQAAMAVLRAVEPPTFENVTFGHPIVAPGDRKTTIRLAAQVTAPGRVEVVLRSAVTGFQIDHFWAVCRFDASTPPDDRRRGLEGVPPALDVRDSLYGGFLFQSGRFRRLSGYRQLSSTSCDAAIEASDPRRWFHRYLPGRLVIGDPAARDAAIHAVQACIPQAVVLPVGLERLIPGTTHGTAGGRAMARERCDLGELLIYDIDVVDEGGEVRERWEGLHLRVVERRDPTGDWPDALLGPYLERRLRALLSGAPAVGVRVGCEGSDRLFRQLLGPEATIWRRPDGRPESDAGRSISSAHAVGRTIACASAAAVACDAEPIVARSEATWRDLLGSDRWELARLIARRTGEAEDAAATRVWAAAECLIKAGSPPGAPMVLRRPVDGRAVVIDSGAFAIATLPLPDGPGPGRPPLMVGFLAGQRDARL